MLIRFLRDFQSMHTGENFYPKDAQAEFESEHAQALIAEGAAEAVPLVVREGQAEPKPPETQSVPKSAPPRGRPRRG